MLLKNLSLIVSLLLLLALTHSVACLPVSKEQTAGQMAGEDIKKAGNEIKKAANAVGCIAKYQGTKC
jgi:hypothetical protein